MIKISHLIRFYSRKFFKTYSRKLILKTYFETYIIHFRNSILKNVFFLNIFYKFQKICYENILKKVIQKYF